MKILHITNNYPTYKNPVFGIFVKEQIESLTNIGLENVVFFINGREKGKLEYFRSIIKLRKYLKNEHFDIVHCHHALSFICLFISGNASKIKTILSYQNDPQYELGKFLNNFLKKRCDAIILKNTISTVNNRSTFYQPNGVNIWLFKPISKKICYKKLTLQEGKRYILFVSSNFVREQKRYDRYKRVIEILRNKYKLLDLEELTLINTRRELVPYYFNVSSLHLLTSDFEGSPNSVKEAMACNIPIVTTNVGDVSDLLSDVNGSFVTKTKNTEELAYFAYMALNNREATNGREILISKELDIMSVAKKIKIIYKRILNE
jgi:glycosyltransferase involved in cell wall biosynthesis